MLIGRKEALLALVATVIPWVGRRANAQDRQPATLRQPQSPELAELQRRVAALEAQLATQVGFTREANGTLRLRGNNAVVLEAATTMSIKAGATAELNAAGATHIKGAVITLNGVPS